MSSDIYDNPANRKMKSVMSAAYVTSETAVGIFTILKIIWILLGLGSLVMSAVCFGYSGTTAEHILGLIFAFLLGPFYWLYYSFSSSYCKSRGRR
jgi:hypothetical protein